MLELTHGGRAVSGVDAIEFLERLADAFPEEIRTEEFCLEYEYVLNRIRYEIAQSVPIKPKIYKRRYTEYRCGRCGHGIDQGTEKYCRRCGRKVDWDGIQVTRLTRSELEAVAETDDDEDDYGVD